MNETILTSVLALSFWMESSIILSITVLFAFFCRYFLGKMQKIHRLPKALKILGLSWHASSFWLILGYGILVIIENFVSQIDGLIFQSLLAQVRSVYLIITFTLLLFSWKRQMEKDLMKRSSKSDNRELVFALGKLSTIFIFLISGLMILSVLDVPLEGLLASGAIGGIAISWAAKDIVANLFGGLMIYLNRHFSVGDWILSPNKNFEGVVEEIHWYMTRIRTFDRRPTFIPNALLIDAIVVNPQRMYNRRIKETIGIRYEDANKMQTIVVQIEKYLKSHPEIDQDQTLMVHFVNFGSHGLNIEIYTFTKTTDWAKWRTIQQEVFLKIVQIIEENGAKLAYPLHRLQFDNDLKLSS